MNRQVGVDTVLGHGRSEVEALQDLEYQIARFEDFLKRDDDRRAGLQQLI